MVGEQRNSDQRSVCSRRRYLQLGFTILCAQRVQSALQHSFYWSKSGGRHSGRATKPGLKVHLFKKPVLIFGFCNPMCAAHAALSNIRFRAKVAQGIMAELRNPDQRSVSLRRQYLHLGFAILCALRRVLQTYVCCARLG